MLVDPPSPSRPPLDAARLAGVGAPWLRLEIVEAAPSTNAAVAQRARGGEPEGLVLVAEHQTAGRGRLQRRWESPARAALTFSVLLRPALAQGRWPWIPLLAGVAVVEGLAAYGAPPCDLKWPNDVMCGGRKLAGILAERVESDLTADGAAALVVGIGLNVSTTRAELPLESATSLGLEGVQDPEPDRTEVLRTVLRSLTDRYAGWVSGGEAAAVDLAAAYRGACRTLGQEVRVRLASGEVLEGRAAEVDTGGGLVVATGSGSVTVSAGDVVHVRPGDPGGGRDRVP